MIKNKPALHVKPGDTIVFTSQVSGNQREDTVVKRTIDEMTNEVSLFFPPEYLVLSDGAKVQVAPEAYVVFPGNKQVQYVA